MTTSRAQRGGFLLEALVGILIFTLGVLGLVALQARAVSYSSDAMFRGEAAYLANAHISKMWAHARGTLTPRFDTAGQPEFDAFQQELFARLPGASDAALAPNPVVTVVQPPPGTGMVDPGTGITLGANSTLVTVLVRWQVPGPEGTPPVVHNYTMTSLLGRN